MLLLFNLDLESPIAQAQCRKNATLHHARMMTVLADQALESPRTRSHRPSFQLGEGDALLVVDVQRDLLPGGALSVKQGEEILPRLNACLAKFVSRALPVFASRDWHPVDHRSFATQGGPWPVHCVAGSPGAQWADGLWWPDQMVVVSKGCEVDAPGYSAFDATDLTQRLRQAGVQRLFIAGMPADYCVQHTARDALAQGWDVVLLSDAVAALDVKAGDGTRALQMIQREGGELSEVVQLAV